MKRTNWLNDNPIGLWLAVAAQAVNAPRLILVYLRVDGIRPPTWLEVALLSLTGIATSLVLSGGGAYLAHTLATPTKRGGWWKVLLAFVWLTMLGCAVVLLAPLMQSGMQSATVAQVLATTARQWTWSVAAVLAVEVVAAGSMLADALRTDALPRTIRTRAPQPAPQYAVDAEALTAADAVFNTAHAATDGAASAVPAGAAAPPAARTYRCAACGKAGMTGPQYAAHKRYCKPETVPVVILPARNGHNGNGSPGAAA